MLVRKGVSLVPLALETLLSLVQAICCSVEWLRLTIQCQLPLRHENTSPGAAHTLSARVVGAAQRNFKEHGVKLLMGNG
jgi:hypothetical protein